MAYSKAEKFPKQMTRMAEIAKALSHPARIAIMMQLCKDGECICGDFVSELPLSQSTVSQHLAELKKYGLIKGEIDGPRVCYCVNEDTWNEAKSFFRSFYSVKLNCC